MSVSAAAPTRSLRPLVGNLAVGALLVAIALGLLSMGLNLNKRVEALPPLPAHRKAARNAPLVAAPMTTSPRRRRMAISSTYL